MSDGEGAASTTTSLCQASSEFDGGRGSAYLILTRPGTATSSGLPQDLASATVTDRAREQPTVMAHNLATSVELLSAANQLAQPIISRQSDAGRLVASLDAFFEAFRQIRRHLKRAI